MPKRLASILLLTIFVAVAASGCVTVRPSKKKSAKVEGQAGRVIASYGISIDANYDPRLDELLPGYKILPVMMKNISLYALPMDAKKDRWVIVGEKGARYQVINSLRVEDPVEWRGLPENLRSLIDYPEILPINYNVTFDLLLMPRANLEYFREIRYYNAALGQEFVITKEY